MATLREMINKNRIYNYNKINRICSSFLKSLKINNFYYGTMNKSGHFVEISTHLDWALYYCENEFARINPFKVKPDLLDAGIYYSPSVNDIGHLKIRESAWERYKIFSCIDKIEKTKTGLIRYGFGIETDSMDWVVLLGNEFKLIRRFVKYFENETADIFLKLAEDPVDIAKEKGANFLKKPSLPKVTLDPHEKIDLMRTFEHVDSNLHEVRFTSQELKCIRMTIDDKTAPEIARRLNISKRTVEYYMNNIKSKLSCQTKSELLHKLHQANTMGLI